MKVYTLTSVHWDWDAFETLEAVGSNLQALIDDRRLQHLPVFSKKEDEQCYNIFALKDGQPNCAEVTVTELLEFMWGKIK